MLLTYCNYSGMGIEKGAKIIKRVTIIIAKKYQQHVTTMSNASATTIKCHYVNVKEKKEAKKRRTKYQRWSANVTTVDYKRGMSSRWGAVRCEQRYNLDMQAQHDIMISLLSLLYECDYIAAHDDWVKAEPNQRTNQRAHYYMYVWSRYVHMYVTKGRLWRCLCTYIY